MYLGMVRMVVRLFQSPQTNVQSQSDPDSAFMTEAFSETIEATEHQDVSSPSAV